MSDSESDYSPVISVPEAFELLFIALGDDPHAPIGCYKLISNCTLVYHEAEERNGWGSEDVVDNPFSKILPHQLLSRFMRFLTVYRNRENVEAMHQKLVTCECATGPPMLRNAHPKLHEEEPFYGKDSSFEHMTNVVLFMVHTVRDAIWEKKKLSSLYRMPNRDAAWPQVWEDLFPYEPSVCIHALGAWHYPGIWSLFNGTAPLLWSLINHFGACLLHGLLKSPSVLHFMIARKEHCEITLPPLPNEGSKEIPIGIETILEDMYQIAEVMDAVMDLMFDDEVLEWAQNVTTHYQSANTLQDFIQDLEETLSMIREIPVPVEELNNHGGIEPQRMVDKIQDTALRAAARIYILAPGLLGSYRPHPDVVQKVNLVRHRWGVPSLRLVEYHTRSRWKHRCFGPGCTVTAHGLQRPLKICSGCHCAKYCSQRCQRSAWKYSRSSHREACKSLRLFSKLNLASQSQFEAMQRMLTSMPHEQAEVANQHLDAIHKSQFDVLMLKVTTLNLDVHNKWPAIFDDGEEDEEDEEENDDEEEEEKIESER